VAIRVRKLARELKRTPGETLGLLHQLGFPRYKNPNDMVTDPIAHKARAAARQGVRAPELPVTPSRAPSSTPAPAPAPDDVMAQLVPGVVPAGRSSSPSTGGSTPPRSAPSRSAPPPARSAPPPARSAPPQPTPAAPPPAPAPVEVPAPSASLAEAERAELQRQIRELTAERDALAARVDELAPLADQHPDGVSVASLLDARGLRGPDEGQRALAELATSRAARSLLASRLGPAAAAQLQSELAKLVLLDGAKPEELSVPAVAVAPERAEAPGEASLARLLSRVGEQLLLSGFRRLRFVGVPPRWHEPIRHRIDRRVVLTFTPGGPRDGNRAGVDAAAVDVVVYVGVELKDGAAEALGDTTWVCVSGGLASALEALLAALQPD